MSGSKTAEERVLAHYDEQFAARPAESVPAWLDALQQEAIGHFAELGFPTRKLEEWKYTNVSRIAKTPFEPASAPAKISSEQLENLRLPDLGGERLIFVDGHYAPGLSTRSREAGAHVRTLVEILDDGAAPARDSHLAHLAAVADVKADAFGALNTAFSRDAAVVTIPADSAPSFPLHLVFVSTTDGERPGASFPRVLLVAGQGSRSSVVQDHVTLGEGATFVDTVCEAVIGENASLQLLLLQREGPEALHIARQCVRQARDSRFGMHTFNLGGALVRNDLSVSLDGEGAECTLRGLYLGDGEQLIDNHTLVDHAMPHCRSEELYKGVIGGRGRGIFRGRVIVRPGAQRTDAQQQNHNLLIGGKAEVDTKPQLEIYADDVKCSHGSTVGQLDPEALFFMRSRGLDEQQALAILTEGFASEVSEDLPDGAFAEWIRDLVLTRLRRLFDARNEA
jgi:Fe-S cluster assembly protein SufD